MAWGVDKGYGLGACLGAAGGVAWRGLGAWLGASWGRGLFLSRSTNLCCTLLGGGVKAIPGTACCCQKCVYCTMAKLSIKKRKNPLFPKNKSLVGLTPVITNLPLSMR